MSASLHVYVSQQPVSIVGKDPSLDPHGDDSLQILRDFDGHEACIVPNLTGGLQGEGEFYENLEYFRIFSERDHRREIYIERDRGVDRETENGDKLLIVRDFDHHEARCVANLTGV